MTPDLNIQLIGEVCTPSGHRGPRGRRDLPSQAGVGGPAEQAQPACVRCELFLFSAGFGQKTGHGARGTKFAVIRCSGEQDPMSTDVPLLVGAGPLPELRMREACTAWLILGLIQPHQRGRVPADAAVRSASQQGLIRLAAMPRGNGRRVAAGLMHWLTGATPCCCWSPANLMVGLLDQLRLTQPSVVSSAPPSSDWSRSGRSGTVCSVAGTVCPGSAGFQQQETLNGSSPSIIWCSA